MSASPRFSQFDVYIFYLHVTNTAEYGGRTCLPALGFLSLMSIFFIYITMAQTVEKNAGLGHAWQKMMCLFTDRRGIDAKPRSR